MGVLYLVGTDHDDLRGPERLKKILNFLKPKYISIEFEEKEAEKSIDFHFSKIPQIIEIAKKGGGLENDSCLEKIEKFLSLSGYEIWVPHNYQKENPETELLYFDDMTPMERFEAYEIENENIFDLEGNLNEDLIFRWAFTDLNHFQIQIDSRYKNVSMGDIELRLGKKFPKIFNRVVERDKKIETGLRDKAQNTSEDGVHVGGVGHMFAVDYHNLYDRLRDISVPIRLIEADKL